MKMTKKKKKKGRIEKIFHVGKLSVCYTTRTERSKEIMSRIINCENFNDIKIMLSTIMSIEGVIKSEI